MEGPTVDFRPWMLEAALGFIRGSRVLWESNLGTPSMLNVPDYFEIRQPGSAGWEVKDEHNAEPDNVVCMRMAASPS